MQGEPHESTGFGDGELLILLCELAALFDGFVEGLAAEQGGFLSSLTTARSRSPDLGVFAIQRRWTKDAFAVSG